MRKAQTTNSDSNDRTIAIDALRAEANAVLNVIDQLSDSFDHSIDLIASCKGNVIVSGMGKSGIIAQKISATLASTGTPSHFLHPAEAMHGDLGRIRANDILILLSYTGQTDEVLALAAIVKQDNVPIIAICSDTNSHLANIADHCLSIGDVTEACTLHLAPTASTTAMLALGDALAIAVFNRRNFTADDFAKRHPSGMLGRLLMPIADILRLRAGHNLQLINEDLTVNQVLAQTSTTGRRAGAVIIIDSAGRLSGIFTDADLARLLAKKGGNALNDKIADVMTKNPISLNHNSLVRDAVQLVREKRIDEIPITDDNHIPLGLIDVQDLMAQKVIDE